MFARGHVLREALVILKQHVEMRVAFQLFPSHSPATAGNYLWDGGGGWLN